MVGQPIVWATIQQLSEIGQKLHVSLGEDILTKQTIFLSSCTPCVYLQGVLFGFVMIIFKKLRVSCGSEERRRHENQLSEVGADVIKRLARADYEHDAE